MRTGLLVASFLVSVVLPAAVFGQTIEMAAKCDVVQKQLAELIKKPGATDAQSIKQALGLDILDSCPTKEGQIICFQCVDKDKKPSYPASAPTERQQEPPITRVRMPLPGEEKVGFSAVPCKASSVRGG